MTVQGWLGRERELLLVLFFFFGMLCHYVLLGGALGVERYGKCGRLG